MNKLILTAATVGLLLSTSFGVAAQGLSGDVKTGVSVEAGGAAQGAGNADAKAGVNANASANANSENGKNNYGQLISSLRTGAVGSADIEALGQDVTVSTVLLSELKGEAAENANALDEALSANSSNVTSVRAALSANANIVAQIEAAGYTVDDVVGVSTAADGGLTLVIDDIS